MKGGNILNLDFLKEITNNLDDKVENFISELTENLNKFKEKSPEVQNTKLNELREEECLYYVIDSNEEKII